jgi:hypothetical protein
MASVAGILERKLMNGKAIGKILLRACDFVFYSQFIESA